MCKDIRASAKIAPNEATIESRFDTEIALLFDKLFLSLGFTYLPIKEDAVNTKRCITKGRADTSVGALIIEYKHPSKLNSAFQKKEAVQQATDYLIGFNNQDVQKSVAFVTDGLQGAFITYIDGNIYEEPFGDLDSGQMDRLVRNIIGLGQKALSSQNLVKDFCIDEHDDQSLSERLASVLLDTLINNCSEKTEMLIEEWEELFKLAHDDQSQQQAIIDRKNALSDYFGRELEQVKEQYLALFALQTTYAIIVKTVAFKVVSQLKYGKDLIDFEKVAEYDSYALKSVFQDLEEGAIFRQYGIMNLLEGDFFSWYSADNQWNNKLAIVLSDMIKTLVKYDSLSIYEDKYKAHDFFKDLYITLMPEAVRHSLGEYYTKHWLAEKVIDDCLAENIGPGWRGIDPCCGSGTFVTVMINKIIEEEVERDNPELLNEIVTRVVGIDLNPIAVLTARVNYFLNISNLITDGQIVEIPIYLGDAAYVPKVIVIDDVECLNYEINTKLKPISINFPKSATSDIGKFSRTMTEIELDIKKLDANAISTKIQNLVDPKDRTTKIQEEIDELAEQLVFLEDNGWNGIWSRIITNYLTTASIGKFDIVVGNPPWVDWKNLPSNYREKIKSLCISRQLFSGDRITGGINLNICALISNVAADNWLKENGVLGFLMPESLLFQQSYEGYRNFYINDDNRLYFQKITNWAKAGHPFKLVQQKFLTYFISSKKQDYKIGIPVENIVIKGRKKCYEEEFLEMEDYFTTYNTYVAQYNLENTMFTYVDTLEDVKKYQSITGGSYYRGREGAEVYPEELLIFTVDEDMLSNDDMVTVINMQNKKSKFKVAQKRQYFEKKFLYPLVKGVDIGRFHLKDSDYITPFPYDKTINTKIAIGMNELQKTAPGLAAFYFANKSILEAQNKYRDKIINNSEAEFYSLARIGEYTFAENFVAYRDNSRWGACVVTKVETPWGEKKRPVFQNHAPYISQDESGEYITYDEAHYICAILNTPIAMKYIVKSSDSCSYPINPRIKLPKYDSADSLHIELKDLSKRAHIYYDNVDIMKVIDKRFDEIYLELCGYNVN